MSGCKASDPRVERSRRIVIDTTLALLVQRGLDHLTMETIADRSGVSKATIYRHWACLDDVLEDAIGNVSRRADVSVIDGTVEARIEHAMVRLIAHFQDPETLPAYEALLQLSRRATRFAKVRNDVRRRLTGPLTRIVEKAIRQEQLQSDAAPNEIVGEILGPLIYRALVGQPLHSAASRELSTAVVARYSGPKTGVPSE